jgi:hypothetical protein
MLVLRSINSMGWRVDSGIERNYYEAIASIRGRYFEKT